MKTLLYLFLVLTISFPAFSQTDSIKNIVSFDAKSRSKKLTHIFDFRNRELPLSHQSFLNNNNKPGLRQQPANKDFSELKSAVNYKDSQSVSKYIELNRFFTSKQQNPYLLGKDKKKMLR